VQIVGTMGVFERFTGRPLGPEDFEPFNWALAELGRSVTVPQYLETLAWIAGFTRRLAGWWTDGFDLLVTPTLPEPPPPLGYFTSIDADPTLVGIRATGFACWTSPFNMSGQPAVSLPLHWTPEGLPVGVQLVAPYAAEDLLLRVAAQLESAAPWASRRPSVHA